MRLVTDWRRVLLLSLSFWLMFVGLAVLILPEIRYKVTGEDYDPNFAWWLGVLLLVAAMGGRVLEQGLTLWKEWLRIAAVAVIVFLLALLLAWPSAAAPGNAAPATEAETLAIAVPFIAKEEGKRNKAYLDAVNVPTICYGSTRGVRLGMVKTDQECLDLLRIEAAEYRTKLHPYFTQATIYVRLPPTRDAAYTSLAFNVGVRGAGKSTATRRLNAGDIAGGCQALTWFDKAGKRVLRGLFERRQREKALCLEGPR